MIYVLLAVIRQASNSSPVTFTNLLHSKDMNYFLGIQVPLCLMGTYTPSKEV